MPLCLFEGFAGEFVGQAEERLVLWVRGLVGGDGGMDTTLMVGVERTSSKCWSGINLRVVSSAMLGKEEGRPAEKWLLSCIDCVR